MHPDNKEDGQTSNSAQGKPNNPANNPQKGYWQQLKDEKPDRHIELLLALAIGAFAAGQWVTSCNVATGNTQQTDQIIAAAKVSAYAATQNLQASRNFADSARRINEGIDRAVARLQAQADIAESARQTSQSSSLEALRATVDNFHQEQRAWLGLDFIVGEFPKTDQNVTYSIMIKNTGTTPAKDVRAYGASGYWDGFTKGQWIVSQGKALGNLLPNSLLAFKFSSRNILTPFEFRRDERYFVYGAVRYVDVFDRVHWFSYCAFSTYRNPVYVNCEAHNDFGDGEIPPDELK